jgi:hypothetical protein
MTDAYPTSPAIGELANGRIWDGYRWNCPALLIDAPADGNTYGRMNNTWQRVLPFNGGELQNLLIDYDLQVLGDTDINGALTVGGDITTTAAITSSDLVATNAIWLTPVGANTFGIQMGSNGELLIGYGSGTSMTAGILGLYANGNVTVTGNFQAGGNIETFNSDIAGDLTVEGNGDITGDVTIGGNVTVGGTVTEGSDVRNKQNVMPCDLGLTLVEGLQPRYFTWRRIPGRTEIGFIAQEVREVLPSVIFGDDATGLSISPMGLISVVVNALKELSMRVAALESS